MRKIITLAVIAMVATTSFAQISWNAKVGMNISSYMDNNMDLGAKVGYRIGGGMEYSLTEIFSIQPSLFLSSKGAKNSDLRLTVNQVYLELPVMAAARFAVADNINAVISLGPYLAYGVGGNTKVKESGVTESVGTFKLFDYNRFDAGVGVGVAFEFGKIIASVDGQVGLIKLNDDITDAKNLNFSIGVGYKF